MNLHNISITTVTFNALVTMKKIYLNYHREFGLFRHMSDRFSTSSFLKIILFIPPCNINIENLRLKKG